VYNKLSSEEANMKNKLSIVLAVVLTLTLLLTSGAFAGGGKKEVVPAQMVLDASLSEVSTVFDIPKPDLEVATSREFSFGADKFLLSSIVDKKSKQAYMVSTDAQGKVWIAEPKIEGELIDHMSHMKPDETVTVSIWAIYVSPEEELWQIPSKYPDVPFEGYLPALGADVSPEVLDSIDADIEEIKLRANDEAVQSVVDFLQSTGSTILYVSKYAPLVSAELSKEEVYKLARLPEAESISLLNEEPEPCLDTAAYTINADDVWDEGYDGGMSDGSGHRQTKVAVIDKGIDFTHDALQHANGGTRPDSEVLDAHGTKCAGCVASIDDTYKGIAYGTKLLDANMWWLGDFVSACDWAHGQRADVYSCSYGWGRFGSWNTYECKYFDHIAYVWWRLPVFAAGNKDLFTAYVASPANAWNVLAVGGIDDKDTEDWADDEIWDGIIFGSCWKNPKTPHGDREKPEVCAPAKDITTTTLEDEFDEVDGTSFAAPQVAGIAAMLMEKDSGGVLTYFPILTKAIIMASAIHNVDNDFPGGDLGFPGEGPDDDDDGVGTVDAYAAYECFSSDRGRLWVDWKEGYSLSPYSLEFDAVAGETVRFVITWYAHTDYSGSSYYGDGLCADLGLEITGTGYYWGEVTFGESHSYDNAWEIVQFYPPYTGTYRATISADAWTGWGEYIAAACYRY
jgi:subtilisin family serine protease